MAPPATEDASQRDRPSPPQRLSSAIPMASPVPTPGPRAPITDAQVPQAPGPRLSRPLNRRGRAVPPGTQFNNANAFVKIPRGPRDRAPLEGIGVSGIHIDRLDLGTSYDRGVCQGPRRSFSATQEKTVQVCFRAVHQRQSERVLVRWSKNGRLVRRAWIVIPAAHAYRTRAGLRLRDASVGSWAVSVESADGVVLARSDFKVTR